MRHTHATLFMHSRVRLSPSVAALILCLCLQLSGCSQSRPHYFADLPSPTPPTPPTLTPSPALFRPIPAQVIPDSSIDAHIPHNVTPADRKIVVQVMKMLPPRLRQYVTWLRVGKRASQDYNSLPNHGLVVIFDKSDDNKQDQALDARDLPGLCVLYYDGKVQPHSNVIYDSVLDRYLTAVIPSCSPLDNS